MKKVAVVGAGFSGAVTARELASAGLQVVVFDSRSHVAGNCWTQRDAETGIMVHKYGPHIFHTSNKIIWDYVNGFDNFIPFINRVKAIANGEMYTLPINLMTINRFFEKKLTPKEAEGFVGSLGDKGIANPISFEDQALKYIGRDLYEAFFEGYTLKQWGLHPKELPASILKRLPVRFNYDDNYYNSTYQGMPEHGYGYVVERILDHPNISVRLDSVFNRAQSSDFDHTFYSGAIDAWFDFSEGRLGYRTLDFVAERYDGDYQGNPVVNYGDKDVPYTRISEHKHFSPWERHENTIVFKEYSRECGIDDIPYYPIRLVSDKEQLVKYVNKAKEENGVTFMGRLGTYRYLDMHITIAEALDVAAHYLACTANESPMSQFVVDPLG